jgi:hypothetical protein
LGGDAVTATRYCGALVVRMEWRDEYGNYLARIAKGGRNVWSAVVGAPASLEVPVDAPVAFDATARAALAFAFDEGKGDSPIDDGDAEYDDAGFLVRRRRADR